MVVYLFLCLCNYGGAPVLYLTVLVLVFSPVKIECMNLLNYEFFTEKGMKRDKGCDSPGLGLRCDMGHPLNARAAFLRVTTP